MVFTSPESLGTLSATYQMHYPTQCSEDVWQTTQVLTASAIASNTYLIKFGVALQANVWYTLRIDLPNPLTSSRITKPFSVYTVTDYVNQKTGIMVDDNRALGTLTILPAPAANAKISTRLDGLELEKVRGVQSMQVDF